MKNRYQPRAIVYFLLIINLYCHGQMDVKESTEKTISALKALSSPSNSPVVIIVPRMDLNSDSPIFFQDLDYPALAVTHLETKSNKEPLFFIDELNKASVANRIGLLLRASFLLAKQYEKSSNEIIVGNPWFLYQGLEDLKKLRKIYMPKFKTKMEAVGNGILNTFKILVPQLSSLKIPSLNGENFFAVSWLEATTTKERDALLVSATDAIKAQAVNDSAIITRELIGFIGVLGYAFSRQKRANSLIALNRLNPKFYQPIIETIYEDMVEGPDAITIATNALKEKNVHPKT